ncbi:MAG: TIGR03619 family F420-dependent LLM class oxidoreductase [Actinobacteria bacterium]|nr:TIGR03619 family F420-dependent LLM class oxidoreductase [Actinomycetota bacterium]
MEMRWSLALPTDRADLPEEFVNGPAVAAAARAAQDCGFDAVYVTDHPAPDQRWLEGGGHHALEPMVVLGYAAAVTEHLMLQTNVYIAAYRNPFLAAKSVLSLDLLSGGRAIIGVAAGYLRPEFGALGVEFDERNELLDECIDVMRKAWTEDQVAFEGEHFRSRGVTMRPRPVAQPHPPIWVGGNSKAAIRRAVERGDGWVPFPNPPEASVAVKSPVISSISDLEQRIEFARSHSEIVGRSAPLDICFSPFTLDASALMRGDSGALIDEVHALEAIGVTWLTVSFGEAKNLSEWSGLVDRLGTDVLGSTK